MSMCWGLGKSGHDDDTKRFEAFKKVPPGKYKVRSLRIAPPPLTKLTIII